MGRPPRDGVAASESLNLHVTPALMAQIDEVRGEMSRTQWAREQIQLAAAGGAYSFAAADGVYSIAKRVARLRGDQ